LAEFLAVVTDPARQPVLVHCEMGVIRTGALVAAYQVLVEGLDSRLALQQMPLFGHHLDKRPAIRDFVLGLHRLRS
jgi:protein tyrosine/serine phosphatase